MVALWRYLVLSRIRSLIALSAMLVLVKVVRSIGYLPHYQFLAHCKQCKHTLSSYVPGISRTELTVQQKSRSSGEKRASMYRSKVSEYLIWPLVC